MRIAARGNIANSNTITQNRLIIRDVDAVNSDTHGDKMALSTRRTRGKAGLPADKIPRPVDEGIKAGFDRREIWPKFQPPRPPALFQPQAHQSARAIPAIAKIGAGILYRAGKAKQKMWAAVNLIAKLAGKADAVQNHRNSANKTAAQIAEFQRLWTNIIARDAGQKIARFRPRQGNAMPLIRDIAIGDIRGHISQKGVFKPAAMRLLHGAGTEQHEMIISKTADRQITIKPPLWREHRGERETPRPRNMPGKNALKTGARASPAKFMLGEIGNLYAADSCLDGTDLAGDIVMAAVALKGGGLMGIIRAIGKPERMFKAKSLSHQRAPGHQPVMERGGFLQPPLWQSLVGEGHDEAALIILRGFDGAPFRRGKLSKAGDIHRPDINRGLAINHPFSHRQANAAALTKASHHANRDPVIAHARHRPDHRVAIRAEGEGAVDDVLDARLANRRNPVKGHFQPVGNALQVRIEKLMPEIKRGAADLPRG